MKAAAKLPNAGLYAAIGIFIFVMALLPSRIVWAHESHVAPKRIMVLYWYNREWPGNVTFDENFQAYLQSYKGGVVEYYSEYLESNRFPGENQSQLLCDYLRQKYADRPIDVVVAVTDAPLDFLLKYRNRLFSGIPIVFVATRRPTEEDLAGGLTGIVNDNDYTHTLELALKLDPETKQIFVVSGTLNHDRTYEVACREAFRDYTSRVSINYLTDLPPDELIFRTRSLPEHSIILFVYQQAKTGHGRLLESTDMLDLVASSTSAPIYGVASWQVGRGIIGGYVRTLESNGPLAAEMALRITRGEQPQDIPIVSTPVVPMFDAQKLDHWRISEKVLPPGSIVRFRPPSFWDENKWYVIVVMSVVLIQSGLIAGLIINRTRRKRAESEHRRAESEITENRARMAGIIDSAMDAIISIDDHSRIVIFNDAASRMFGCRESEAIGQAIDRFIPERFRKVHSRHIHDFGETDIMVTKSMGRPGSLYGLRANGEEFPIEASISKVDLGGRKLYTVILRDITERHQVLESLRESEERFRNMADTAPVMIWITGVDKLCTYVNPQWLKFTGRSFEEELGNGWQEVIHPDDADYCHRTTRRAFDVREPFTMEYRVRRADGEYRWILDTGTARFSPKGEFRGYIGSCIDITERKEAEEALANLSRQLIHAREDECARIARDLHDDVNQRMALISVELAQLGQNPTTPGHLRKQLNDVIGQVAETSREIHRMSYDLHPSKLVHLGLIAALKSLCDELHQRHGLEIRFANQNVPSNLSRDISLCLYRIAQECLTNVIRHSGVKEASVELRRTAQEIRLRVSDGGVGFDMESPRLKNGLGLVSMRERLRLVGGSISIDSRPSNGTRIDAVVPWNGDATSDS